MYNEVTRDYMYKLWSYEGPQTLELRGTTNSGVTWDHKLWSYEGPQTLELQGTNDTRGEVTDSWDYEVWNYNKGVMNSVGLQFDLPQAL